MFFHSARVYDAIYGAFKDYESESARVAELIRDQHPHARTVLDVGCGTGEHVRFLRRRHGYEVEGLDLDPGLLDAARQKVPEAAFHEADMGAFELGRRYDVAISLFGAIGYLRSLDRVTAAFGCLRRHLAFGGAVIVEPWLAPGMLREGTGTPMRGESEGLRVERTSHATEEGRVSRLVFEYRLEDADGVRTAREVHELGLFTPPELLASFRAAGLRADYDPEGLNGRGLYVGRVA